MIITQSEIIGYYAHSKNNNSFCDNDACVIAKSNPAMISIISKQANIKNYYVRQINLKEILTNLENGITYAFDQNSFDSFNQALSKNNINFNLDIKDKNSTNLIRVKLSTTP
ncbi:hypothetical protein L3V83_14100 [Thiotrichales bacterium 19X7-9]|nr:hypothetical protein [Thiotrichales bacterium 19X7-9]